MLHSLWRGRLALLLVAMLAISQLGAAIAEDADEAASLYLENDWDFVDDSMDISSGIPADAEGVLADIRESGLLRVATEPYFPPQEFIDPDREGQDQYVGSDMELARLIAQRMGVTLEIVPLDFSEVLDAVVDGRCDLAISALSYTPGRAAKVTLSKGYNFAEGSAGSGIMIRAADSGAITDLAGLKGRNIAAQSGSLQESLMADNVFRYHEFRRLETAQDLYDALTDGSVDAVMVDYESGMNYVESNPESGLMMLPGVHFTLEEQFDGDRIAAKKGEGQLIGFVNGVIDEVLQSGQYRAWFDTYTERAAQLGM